MQESYRLTEAAEQLGVSMKTLREWMGKLSIVPHRVPGDGRERRLTSAQMNILATAEKYNPMGRPGPIADLTDIATAKSSNRDALYGWFYLVVVVPNTSLDWVKLGFTTNTKQRLTSYHTIVPTAEMIATWPCLMTWERAAMASATREGCEYAGGEVFVCHDIQALKERIDAFFAVMPKPSGDEEAEEDESIEEVS